MSVKSDSIMWRALSSQEHLSLLVVVDFGITWATGLHTIKGGYYQCDQMARLHFQYLAIYTIENLPNSTSNLPKCAQSFVKYSMNP